MTLRSSGKKVRRMRRGLGSLPTANGGIARAAYNVAITRGLDVQPLLKRSNLTTAQIKKPHVRIAARAQIAFLNEVASAIQDDFLGVHLAQSLDLRELGLLYYVLASSETLGEALKRLARYSGIHNEGVHITCQDRNALGIDFQYFGVSRVSDFHQIEFFVTVLLRLCRELSGRRILPIAVQFTTEKALFRVKLRRSSAAVWNSALVKIGSYLRPKRHKL